LYNINKMGNYFSTYTTPAPAEQQTNFDPQLMYQGMMMECRSEMQELSKQNEALRSVNDKLANEVKSLNKKVLQKNDINTTRSQVGAGKTPVSTDALRVFIDEMLENQDLNIRYMPDFVEKQLYHNIFYLLLNLLDHIVETSQAQFMGHEIKFVMQPIGGTNVNDNEDNEDMDTEDVDIIENDLNDDSDTF
jgi:hypothetical protein